MTEPSPTMNTVKQSALITEPLSDHSAETMLAACRAAIANGEDVNALDTWPQLVYSAGRPLDACLRQTQMPGKKSIKENLPIIELLVEHGADPRLYSRITGPQGIPILVARRYAFDEDETEEHRAFWVRVLQLFEEAIVRLDAKKEAEGKETEEKGADQKEEVGKE